jgi:HlyD family secretion protein
MKRSTSIITAVYILGLVGFIAHGYSTQTNQPSSIIQGTVEAPEIRISAKIPGRVADIYVHEGQKVAKGDLIFSLESPELEAKRAQAQALIDAKTALSERAQRGARSEEVQIAKDNLARARTGEELAKKSLQRIQNLYNDGLIPAQDLDEAQAKATAAKFARQAAEQQNEMAQNGTERELIDAAHSDLQAAEGVLAEVEAALAETQIHAQRSGIVTDVLIHAGEISPAGFPVVTLVDMDRAYVRFHVLEDQLSQFKQDETVNVLLPGLDKNASLTISDVSVMGDYANWRASTPGEYDLRTFEIQARPAQPQADWRVGLTAVITPPQDNQ